MDDFNKDTADTGSRLPVPSNGSHNKSPKKGLIVLLSVIGAALLTSIVSMILIYKSAGAAPQQAEPVPQQTRPDAIPDKPADNPFDQFKGGTFIKKLEKRRPSGDYIAVLHIVGVIQDKNKTYNQAWLLNTIDDLMDDSRNKAIMLYINSPGGGVYQADNVYLELEAYKKTGRPVYAYMGPLVASGGYYIACAAEHICANRNTLTGSIGVIAGQSMDATGLMDKIGIKSTTITSGRNKNMMNFNAPFTDEQKAIMQAIADTAYDQFTGIVADSRKMPIDTVTELADGRLYTARQAESNGLIDEICTWEQAIDSLISDKKLDENCSIEHYRYEEKTSLYDYMTGAAAAISEVSAAVKNGTVLRLITGAFTPQLTYPAAYYEP